MNANHASLSPRPANRLLAGAGILGLIGAAAPAQSPPEPQPFRLDAALGTPDSLKVSGTYRTRFESLHGQFRSDPALRDNEDQIASRGIVRLDFDRDRFGATVEAIDSRMFLTEDDSFANTTTVNTFDLLQANARYRFAGSNELTVGRYTMDLGSRRLIARNKYRNTINSFNGVRWEHDGAAIDVGAFWNLPTLRRPTSRTALTDNEHDWDRQSTDLQFFGVHLSGAVDDRSTAQVYVLGLHDDRPGNTTRELFTPGLRYHRAARPGAVSGEFEAAYQFGERGNADVEGFFGHASVGYTFDVALAPSLRAAIDVASGNDASDPDYGRFDTLFGARRFEYGPTGIYGAIGRRNLVSPELRASVRPTDATWVMVAVRDVRRESSSDAWVEARDGTGGGRSLGQQVECRLRWDAVPKSLRLETGGAYFAGGDFRDTSAAGRASDSRYFFFETILTF